MIKIFVYFFSKLISENNSIDFKAKEVIFIFVLLSCIPWSSIASPFLKPKARKACNQFERQQEFLAHLSKLLGGKVPNNLNKNKLLASGEGRKYENSSKEAENESPYFEQDEQSIYSHLQSILFKGY